MLSFNSQSFQLFNVFRSLSLFLLFLCIYQSFLSTYKDIIGKLSIHHIMFFAYGSSKRKWKPFLLLLPPLLSLSLSCSKKKREKKTFFFLLTQYSLPKIWKWKSITNLSHLISIICENFVLLFSIHSVYTTRFFSRSATLIFYQSVSKGKDNPSNDVTNIMGCNLIWGSQWVVSHLDKAQLWKLQIPNCDS